jgi:outer membrane murein-binding lipoprotein Lpp
VAAFLRARRLGLPASSTWEKIMKKLLIAAVAASSIGLAGCTSDQAIFGGAVAGAAIGGVATHSVGGAVLGAAVGGLAGAYLVKHNGNGWCTYKYKGKLYTDRCR